MVHIDHPPDPQHDFTIKQNATDPNVSAVLEDDEDDPINLTGASVRFKMKSPGSDTMKVHESAFVTDADGGEVEYPWSTGDTDSAGHFHGEFAVDYSGATGQNFDPDEFIPSDRFLSIYINNSL